MLNPIILFSALHESDIDNYVKKIDKCSVYWVIKEIEIKKSNECLDNLSILVENEHDFIVNSYLLNDNLCSFDWYNIIYSNWNNSYNLESNLPKKWDFVNLLIDKNYNTILSDNLNENWYFELLSWNILKQEINKCEFEEDYSNYYLWWIIISLIFIFLSLFLIVKLIKKK